ncbi:hypothetical protein B0T19DRAFT_396588 [Cercophora scortea]|uniref:Uncharacterized protein n=1 Tax=Cercophora scortea TaxID=314031 RepID=A0AAE0J4Q0_9PEZI|nr:hypothetical protein B0T19DRAFT_396588 [Cercophora scortea]
MATQKGSLAVNGTAPQPASTSTSVSASASSVDIGMPDALPQHEALASAQALKRVVTMYQTRRSKRHPKPAFQVPEAPQLTTLGGDEPSYDEAVHTARSSSTRSSSADETDKSGRTMDHAGSDTTNLTTPEMSGSDSEMHMAGSKRKHGQVTESLSEEHAVDEAWPSESATIAQAATETEEQAPDVSKAAKKLKKSKSSATDDAADEPQAAAKKAAAESKASVTTGSVRGAEEPATLTSGRKKRKKQQLEDEGDESVQPKKSKSSPPDSISMTPAIPPSPKRNGVKLRPKEYFEQRVHEMLSDPLGFDDMVHDDTRPQSRPRYRRFGFRWIKKPKTHISPALMSGGLGVAPSKKAPANNTRSSDKLSKQVLKNGHNKKVAADIRDIRETAGGSTGMRKNAGQKGSNSSPKYNKSAYSPVPTVSDVNATSVSGAIPRAHPGASRKDMYGLQPTMTTERETPGAMQMGEGGLARVKKNVYHLPRDTPRRRADIKMPSPERAWFKRDFQSGQRRNYNLPMFSSLAAQSDAGPKRQAQENEDSLAHSPSSDGGGFIRGRVSGAVFDLPKTGNDKDVTSMDKFLATKEVASPKTTINEDHRHLDMDAALAPIGKEICDDIMARITASNNSGSLQKPSYHDQRHVSADNILASPKNVVVINDDLVRIITPTAFNSCPTTPTRVTSPYATNGSDLRQQQRSIGSS